MSRLTEESRASLPIAANSINISFVSYSLSMWGMQSVGTPHDCIPHKRKLSEDDRKEMFIDLAAIDKDAFAKQLIRDLPKNISGLERCIVRQQRSLTTSGTSGGVRKIPGNVGNFVA